MERDSMSATTDDMISALRARFFRSLRRMTSMPKNTPAMGALKTAEMAAPAPAAVYIIMSSLPNLKVCERKEPIPLPILAAGPSGPRGAPVPMEIMGARR